ncbi:MAG: hypothetical protein N2450_05290 [bacterium]|nr:hypothetical protein [bacterium]
MIGITSFRRRTIEGIFFSVFLIASFAYGVTEEKFKLAKIRHVQKEMIGFTAERQIRERFLQQLVQGNAREIRLRRRAGEVVPTFSYPEGETEKYFNVDDTLNIVVNFYEYRDSVRLEYDKKLTAARKIKKDLLATASPIALERMRIFDWSAFYSAYGANIELRSDPQLALLISDEYARNYPQALADSFWFYRGEAALTAGYYREAIESYDRVFVLETSAFRPKTIERLAFLYAELGDAKRADRVYQVWLKAGKPLAADGKVAFHIGRAQYEAGNYIKAIEALRLVPNKTRYAFRAKLLLGSALANTDQYDSAIVVLRPFITQKVIDRVAIEPEQYVYAALLVAQIRTLMGKGDEGLKILSVLDVNDVYGDKVLFTKAWIYRTIGRFDDMAQTADLLVRKKIWSPYVPIASAWLSEVAELKADKSSEKSYINIIKILEQSQKASRFAEERLGIYRMMNELHELEAQILLKEDIELFRQYLREQGRLTNLLEYNLHHATLISNPLITEISMLTDSLAKYRLTLNRLRQVVDTTKSGKLEKQYIRLRRATEILEERLQEIHRLTKNLQPAIRLEQDQKVLLRELDAYSKKALHLLSEGADPSTLPIPDRATMAHLNLDKFSSQLISMKMDQIRTNIDAFAGFALQRYALGGLDFDVLVRHREQSDELTLYINQINALIEARNQEFDEVEMRNIPESKNPTNPQ